MPKLQKGGTIFFGDYMKNFLEKTDDLTLSFCDNTGKFGYPDVFAIFCDIATKHAGMLGLGAETLTEKGLFWVTAKTMVRFKKRPSLGDEFTVKTWPEKPSKIRCNRYYTITQNGECVIEGKNEWAVLDKVGRPHKIEEIYPAEIEHLEDKVLEYPFSKISDDFSEAEVIATYKVRSTDIDIAGHTNNVAYLRILFGAMTCAEIEALPVSQIEITYKSQSYEGEMLEIRKQTLENGIQYGILKPDGKAVALILIKTFSN